MSRIRLELEHLEDRCTPSTVVFDAPLAFTGLDVAVERFVPPNPVQVAPVFALNYGDSVDTVVPAGLNVAVSQFTPVDPCMIASPIFAGLAQTPPSVDL